MNPQDTETSECEQRLGLGSGQGPTKEGLAGSWPRKLQDWQDAKAEGDGTA